MVASGYIAKNNIMEWLIKTRLLNNFDQVERPEKNKSILSEFDASIMDNARTISAGDSGASVKGKHRWALSWVFY